MANTEVAHVDRVLTAQDRCDRCGAQAYVMARFGAGELLFCAHHARENHDAIADHIVIDNSTRIGD